MNIVFVAAELAKDLEDTDWRGAVIARALARSGRHTTALITFQDFSSIGAISTGACQSADAIVLQGIPGREVNGALHYWRSCQKTILADLQSLSPEMHLGIGNLGSSQSDSANLSSAFELVDAVVVNSRQLIPMLAPYSQVIYLPDYLEFDRYYPVRTAEHAGILLGWYGGGARLVSAARSGLLDALQRICLVRQDVRLLVSVDHNGAFPMLPLPKEHLLYHPWVPKNEWNRVMAQLDIGLAPLDEPNGGSYNDVLKFMASCIPWVASNNLLYNDLHHYGWIVQNTPGAWERVLIDMIDHLESYKREASGAAFLFGVSHNIDEHIDEIVSAFTKLQPRPLAESDPPQHNYLAVHHQISSPELATRQLAASKVLISKHTEAAALAQANMLAPHLLPLLK